MRSLSKQFEEIVQDYSKEMYKSIDEALNEVGEILIKKLSDASPVGDSIPHFKDSWAMKTKYKNVRYIGNTKTAHHGIPLSNLLEYGSKGKPFIIRTFNASRNELYSKLINKIGGKV